MQRDLRGDLIMDREAVQYLQTGILRLKVQYSTYTYTYLKANKGEFHIPQTI